MIINYGISNVVRKPHTRKRIIHQNHTLEVDTKGICFNDAYPLIKSALNQEIKTRYPGWHLSGFAQKVENKSVKGI